MSILTCPHAFSVLGSRLEAVLTDEDASFVFFSSFFFFLSVFFPGSENVPLEVYGPSLLCGLSISSFSWEK